MADSANQVFAEFPKVQNYRLIVTTDFTSEDIYGNQKTTNQPAVKVGVTRSTNAKINWPVLKNRCKRVALVVDEHWLHPALLQAYIAGSKGCWASR
jgi:hypothetical protein